MKSDNSFSYFFEVGCTPRQRNLIKNSFINRIHFFFGLRFAYVAWLLGLSANVFTLIRVPIALLGFYLITMEGLDNLYIRLSGIVLIVFQKFFDFGDGALSRARKESSPVGRQLDILVDVGTKVMGITLISYFSNNQLMIICSSALVYMHWRTIEWIEIGRSFFEENTKNVYYVTFKESDKKIAMPSFLEFLVSSPLLLYFVPLIYSIINSPEEYEWLAQFSQILFIFYSVIITIMYYLALFPRKIN